MCSVGCGCDQCLRRCCISSLRAQSLFNVQSSDPNEGTPSEISREEDSGGLGLQGGPDMPGKMMCESPKWVKYDWPWEPEHSGLVCIGVPEDQEACIFQLAEWNISTAECCKKQRVNSAQQGSSG